MAREIERKYLLTSDAWRAEVEDSVHIKQGWPVEINGFWFRIRLYGLQGWIALKRATDDPAIRDEWEEEISLDMASRLLMALCPKTIQKVRHSIGRWEIDEFQGDNEGLIVAEIELNEPDEEIDFPDWVGEEVTKSPNYLNVSLIEYPFCDWAF